MARHRTATALPVLRRHDKFVIRPGVTAPRPTLMTEASCFAHPSLRCLGLQSYGERIDHARSRQGHDRRDHRRDGPCAGVGATGARVKGLRIVGWSAGIAALTGAAAVALLVGHMPLHAGTRAPSMLYGATFAPVGSGRPGLVVTSLRSGVVGDSMAAVKPPLQVGDTVLTVDDRPASSFALLREEALRSGDAPVRLRVARDDSLLTITLLRRGPGGLRGQQDIADRR